MMSSSLPETHRLVRKMCFLVKIFLIPRKKNNESRNFCDFPPFDTRNSRKVKIS